MWSNIGQFTSAFEKTKNGIYHGTKYDMNSIMHYPWNAFSANGKNTLKPLKATTATPYKEVNLHTLFFYENNFLRGSKSPKIKNNELYHVCVLRTI